VRRARGSLPGDRQFLWWAQPPAFAAGPWSAPTSSPPDAYDFVQAAAHHLALAPSSPDTLGDGRQPIGRRWLGGPCGLVGSSKAHGRPPGAPEWPPPGQGRRLRTPRLRRRLGGSRRGRSQPRRRVGCPGRLFCSAPENGSSRPSMWSLNRYGRGGLGPVAGCPRMGHRKLVRGRYHAAGTLPPDFHPNSRVLVPTEVQAC
jgi:hypothetical protein